MDDEETTRSDISIGLQIVFMLMYIIKQGTMYYVMKKAKNLEVKIESSPNV